MHCGGNNSRYNTLPIHLKPRRHTLIFFRVFPAKAQKIGEEYRAEQDRTDELYEALEAAELAVEEAENE